MDQSQTHDKMHWHCCWMPMMSKLLWVLGLLDLIAGGIAYWKGGEFYGIAGQTWLWFALVKGVLATGAKGKGHHGCGGSCGGNCMPGKQ